MIGEPNPVVLVVEDEKSIRRFVRQAFEAEGYRVFEAETQARGLVEAGTRRPDLVLVDLGLPDGDGVELIRQLRGFSGAPVIVLSARSSEDDKVGALDAGADDYLVKPFGVAELLARTRAALRRGATPAGRETPQVGFGDVDVDLAARRVMRAGVQVHLTPVEFKLLAALLRYPDKVLTHRHLLREVWGPSHTEDTHYLRIYMANLRRKLEQDPARPRHLITETAVGYRFVPEATDADGPAPGIPS
jgi:two-component system KDP operon response regulator KdpE